MIKLIKNADVYTPRHIGRADVLIANDRIAAVEWDISGFDGLKGVEIFDFGGKKLIPGFVDAHVHITGGGGESGPASRVPEITLSQLTLNGITTVVGLLGTDGITRSLENLLAKCRALNGEGITCYCLTGSYQYPTITATGSVMRDICLLDPVIGVKIAIADHRSSGLTGNELIRLGADARLGGLISGKPGIVTIHVGSSGDMLDLLFYTLDHSDIPIKNFIPTHLGRSTGLIKQAAEFVKRGGTADFTADDGREECAADIIYELVESGIEPERLTISSDSCGSLPRFNERGECIGLTYATPATMMKELKRLTFEHNMPLETALLFLTKNPARMIGKAGVKGEIIPGADADIVVLDEEFTITDVFARGVLAVANSKPIIKGMFE